MPAINSARTLITFLKLHFAIVIAHCVQLSRLMESRLPFEQKIAGKRGEEGEIKRVFIHNIETCDWSCRARAHKGLHAKVT